MSRSGYFVTGTDTGVGKTFVASTLALLARARGKSVRVMKPVETGCQPTPSDAMALRLAADDPRPIEEICPYALKAPVSPHAAARAEGRALDVGSVVALFPTDGDIVLVEGAGGILSPLNESALMADLAARLGLPLVVVVRHSLGAINQALMAIEVARHRQLEIAAVVLNQTADRPDPAASCHAEAIAAFGHVRVLGPTGYHPEPAWSLDALGRVLDPLL